MRDFIDAILVFIGTSSMTDGEFESLSIVSYGYDQETYEAILAMINAYRDGVSTLPDRLKAYFEAKGVEISTPQPTAKSHIFVGGDLS
jgi:hypothetical protein